MKVCNEYVVKIEDPEGDAYFTFRRPAINEGLQRDYDQQKALEKIDDPKEKAAMSFKYAIADLVKVEGLFDPDGKPLTVDRMHNLELDVQTMIAIARARAAVLNGDNLTPEKKDSSSVS